MGDLVCPTRIMRARASGNMPTALGPGQIMIDEYLGKLVFPDASTAANASGQYTVFVSIDLKGLVAALTAVRSLATGGTGQNAASSADLLAKLGAAALAGASFTGAVTAPTPASGDNSTKVATTAFVQALITALINAAPAALDTLGEIATQLSNDESAASALTNTVAGKLAKASNLSDLADVPTARSNLGVAAGAAADLWAGTATGKVITPKAIYDASAFVALTDAATVAVDLSTLLNAKVTLGGNRTLGNPTNAKDGQSGISRVLQDATGSRTLSFGTAYDFGAAGAPTLQTAAGKEDLIFYVVVDAATPRLRCTFNKGA